MCLVGVANSAVILHVSGLWVWLVTMTTRLSKHTGFLVFHGMRSRPSRPFALV